MYHNADCHTYSYVIIPTQCQICFIKVYFLKCMHSNDISIFSFPAEKHDHDFEKWKISLYLFLAKSTLNLDVVRHSDYDLTSG